MIAVQKLTTVASSIDGGEHLMLFKRTFEHEGSLKLEKVERASSTRKKTLLKSKHHYWFLFNDVIVLCSPKKVIGEGKLFDHVETTYICDIKTVTGLEDKKLQLVFNNKEIWNLVAHSTKDREQWVQLIDILMKEFAFRVPRKTLIHVQQFVSKLESASQETLKKREAELGQEAAKEAPAPQEPSTN